MQEQASFFFLLDRLGATQSRSSEQAPDEQSNKPFENYRADSGLHFMDNGLHL